MKDFAVGIVTLDRWELTKQTLDSLANCDQSTTAYDLFLIDNGSSTGNLRNLKDYIKSSGLPVKNAMAIDKMIMPKAWNLFLSLASDYSYRVKLDNDIWLSQAKPTVVSKKPLTSQFGAGELGNNPGAIPSGPPIRGMGAARKISANRKLLQKMKSKKGFLTNMLDFANNNDTEITSLITIPPRGVFSHQYGLSIKASHKGLPFVTGGCMMISKKCFDTLGYFHEHLPRRIDVEYSQRAIRNGLNIGYHPYSYAVHAGFNVPTEGADQYQFNIQEANSLENVMPIETRAESEWEPLFPSIKNACENTKFLHLV